MNKVLLCGRLGKDPEVKTTAGGRSVCRMSVATEERWVKEGEAQKITDWHQVIVWGKPGEACGTHLTKGSLVLIEGLIRTRQYEHGGTTRYTTEIIAAHVDFLDPRRAGGAAPPAPAASEAVDDDDIPF